MPSILLLLPLVGNAIFAVYLLGLTKALNDRRLIERARMCVGGVNGIFFSLALTLIIALRYSFSGALIFFGATFPIIYFIFRILVAFLLMDLGNLFKVEALRYGGYLFPFLPFLGPFLLVGILLLIIGFYDASKLSIKKFKQK